MNLIRPVPGLSEADNQYIFDVLQSTPGLKRVVLFGSRAKGNWKPASDIDLALYGSGVNLDLIARLLARLQDSGPLPWRFDLVDGMTLEHQGLKDHLARVGLEIFRNDPA